MDPILIMTQLFPPEVGAAAHRMERLTSFLRDKGIPVEVVTWFPHYPQRVVHQGYSGWIVREEINGIPVRRVAAVVPKPTTLRRMFAEAWLTLGTALLGLFGRRPSVVYASTPSALLAVGGWIVALVRNAVFVLEVRDLIWRYPAAIAGRSLGPLERLVERVMKFVGRRATLVVTTTPDQAAFFSEAGVSERQIMVVPNGVSTVDLQGEAPQRTVGAFTVLYTGMVGMPQGLSVLVKAAELLRNEDVRFILVGDGLEKAQIREECQRLGLSNISFVPAVPRSELACYYAQADLLFAHLRGAQAFETALPSKLLDYMSTGKPILFGGRGVAAREIQRAGAGIVVPPDDPLAIAEAIRQVMSSPDRAQQMGSAGRAHVLRHYVSERLFEGLLTRLTSTSFGLQHSPMTSLNGATGRSGDD